MERIVKVLPERIEGEGVLLRRWRVDDAEALGRAVGESADHLRPWMAFMAEEPQTLEQREQMLRDRELVWSQGGDVMLAIIVDDAVAGSCGLHRRGGPKTGIECVEIHHDKANTASSGVAKRLGFRFVGETPDEGNAPAAAGIDCTWRMDRDDWATKRSTS